MMRLSLKTKLYCDALRSIKLQSWVDFGIVASGLGNKQQLQLPLVAYSVEKLLFRATWENISLLDRFFFDGRVSGVAQSLIVRCRVLDSPITEEVDCILCGQWLMARFQRA